MGDLALGGRISRLVQMNRTQLCRFKRESLSLLFSQVEWTTIKSAEVQFENNHFTEMCSGSEAGLYLRRIDCVYHSTLGFIVTKKKKKGGGLVASGTHHRNSVSIWIRCV